MTPDNKRAVAALITDAAGLVALEVAIARMRRRTSSAGGSGATIKHPWLLAVAAEVAAQLGDAIVYQRHRAAAAIDRAVAAQHVPAAAAPSTGSPALRIPASRKSGQQPPLQHARGTSRS